MSREHSKPRGLSVHGTPQRVLIVDDNRDLVDALKAVLESVVTEMGVVSVTTAVSGKEALLVADRDGFDVAIIDVQLPDTSGVELIGALRELSAASEVILITGFATVDAAIGALRSGAFAFVLKSFRPEELRAIVEQALAKVGLKRSREELERRYRDLVELTDVLVVALDDSLRVVLFNQKAVVTTGTERADALGMSFLDAWIPSRDRHRMNEALLSTIRERRAREVETEFEARGKVRRVRWQLSFASGVVNCIGVDVTERLALEKRAADSEALSAMGVLAMNLAHEIRNPLNAANLQLHLLGRQVDKMEVPDEVKDSLKSRGKIVAIEINRLNRMLTEFLELARPRGIVREPVHLGRLVNDVLELEHEAAKAKGIEIVRDLSNCVTTGDREKLKQVVLNVVVNAFEAMKEGGTLTARVSAHASDSVAIEIEDDGPGIDEAVLQNIFDPFFTTKEAGTGLGLSIVRKVVDQHHGAIEIENASKTRSPLETPSSERRPQGTKGPGTRVRIVLPSR
ncbi:MAG: ATP-binding protein [Polyangiaceae bacterium]